MHFYACRQAFAVKDLGISSYRVKIIPNWTVTEDLLSIGSRKKYLFPLKKVNILYVGWLEWHKGIEGHKPRCYCVGNTSFKIHLTVVGNGYAEQGCKKLSTQLGMLIASHLLVGLREKSY